ncbi:MAG: amino acid adenylation domain-containing protein [Oscillatoriophycideae cyanobacterium NC_groundwater_1537_Pr4_S-0.65um_50_18]|nr:amino acid adenylation domain-containing protein [Oscillatoriophycideae cyanobacterium NC_groundwater_1537_Pr4_S-0.65um_50_18]
MKINDSELEVTSVHQKFEAQVRRSPQAIAVEFADHQLTYQVLDEQANQLAHYLQSLGVQADVRVGLCFERSIEMIIAILGILKAGGAYLPLDPTYPVDRLAFMLENARVSLVLTHSHLVDRLPRQKSPLICVDADRSTIANQSSASPASRITPDHLAYVIYTSGSTGKPKGVAMPHRPLLNLINWQTDDSAVVTGKTLQFAPISFDVSFQEIFATLTVGGTLVLIAEETRRDPVSLLQFLDRAEIKRLFLPFVALQSLAEVAVSMGMAPPALREVITAGEQLRITPAIVQWFDQMPYCTLYNHYGPSESHVVTAYTLSGAASKWALLPPIGKPIAHTQIHLLNSQLQPVPPGAAGEIYIGGVCLARGYLHRPDLTADRFITLPALSESGSEAGERLYKTGDLARLLPDGNLEYLGRADQQVKIRGYRIEPGEVEAVLEQHAAVLTAVVVVREDKPQVRRLVGYVVPTQTVEASHLTQELRQFLKAQLPEYMLPSAIVCLDQLPLTPSGKVDRHHLPVPPTPELESLTVPETVTQAILAEIWVHVLGLEQVGIHDHFLDLGGHSLLAIQMISRIRDRFHIELPLRCLLESPTISQLAEQVETAQRVGDAMALIQRAAQGKNLPLSFMQESLWFLDQLTPNHPVYIVPEAFRLQGCLNVIAMQQSFQHIIDRHESVRTVFRNLAGKPIQVIQPAPAFQLSVVDLTFLTGSVATSPASSHLDWEVQEFLLKEARLPFNLAEDLLLRATLFKLSETEHILLVTQHHMVTDGWSIAILLEELAAFYRALTSESEYVLPEALPELTLQYADFAVWQRSQDDRRSKQLAYWQQQLSDLPLLQLPTDWRSSHPTYRGARQFLTLSQPLTQKLQELSRQEGVTLFVTLLAAFQTLLFHYTGQTDLPIGSLVANRSHSELEKMIGFFVNTLVLRTDLSGSPSFRELMYRVRSVTLEAYAHQDLPFEQLVQALHPDRDLNQNPLVQVLFNFQNTPTAVWDVPQLRLTHLPIDNQTAKFDLLLELTETPTGLAGFFEYSTDLFATETIVRMQEHWQALLEKIVTNPIQSLADLSLLTAAEQQQVSTWNQTQMDFPDECLHQLIEAQVERTPDAIAVEFGDRHFTYRQLNQRANQLAHHLQTLGVKPNVLVGICVERSLDLMVGLLGILKAGGAYVPLDPAYPSERLALMLEDVQVLVTQQPLLEKLTTHQAATLCLDRDWTTIATASLENPQSAVQPSDLAYVLYTSGSTGKPKGVQIEQRSIVNLLTFMRQEPGLTEQDILLAVTTISFDIAAVELYLPLIVGARTVLVSRCVASDAAQLAKTLEKSDATFMQATPATWRLLLSVGWQGNPNLRIVCCGEALSRDLANRLLERCHTLWNMYGPTETTIYSTLHQVRPASDLVPIGRPVANTQIWLLAQTGEKLYPVPIGVPGELYIGGQGLAQAYLNRPDLTAERFIEYIVGDRKTRLYKTGDLARYQSDGTIEYLGRIDHQVKIRGFRIELGEVETALSQHPNVRESIVIAREEANQDSLDSQRLIAYVVSRHLKGSTHLVSELRAFLRRKLPEFMVPTAFVVLDSLPMTPNGKVDRRALPAPNPNRPDLPSVFVAPQTATEQQLAQIWTQALAINQVGIHDNFFDLGGHSLLAAQILFQIQSQLNVELALRNIFLAPTIAELSQLIAEQQTGFSGTSIAPPDLRSESILDPTIQADGLPIASLLAPQHILLTGATGFLGAFLLHEILEQTQADVYCLLRAKDAKDAARRLQQSLEFYSLWNPNQASRIIPLIGNLSLPHLGLSSKQFDALAGTIDVIYHNASWINFVYPYSVLRSINVQGTQEILRLASHIKVKAVHFLSSLGVYAPSAYPDGLILEEKLPDRTTGLYGYTQTKWVSENLIRVAQARGIPAAIYRPAWIEGHSQSGVCNHSDFLRSLIKGCIQLGVAPNWHMPVDIVPVDFTSRAIVHLSQQNTSLGKAFNLSNPSALSWNQLIAWLCKFGYSLQMLSYSDWITEAVDRIRSMPDNALYPYLTFLTEKSELQMTVPEVYFQTNHLQFDGQNVIDGLAESSIAYPTIDHQLLTTYFSHFISSGFLEPPRCF